MSDIRSLPKWKRCLLFFSLLICFVSLNFSLFSVTARANVADGDPANMQTYVAGMPFDVYFGTVVDDNTYQGVAQNVTKFLYSPLHTPAWVEGDASNDFFTWSHDTSGFSVMLDFPRFTHVAQISSYQPIFVSSMQDIDQWFNCRISVYYPVGAGGSGSPTDAGQMTVQHVYNILVARVGDDGLPVYETVVYRRNVDYTQPSSLYNEFFMFPSEIFGDQSFWNEYASFSSDDGVRYAWIMSSSALLFHEPDDNRELWTSRLIFTPWPDSDHQVFSSWIQNIRSREVDLIRAESVNVQFDDISWTDWLVNSVGSFMNFEIVPNLTISGIVALLVGMSLFMVFLKVFAGG